MDVTSFYTNIPQEEGINILCTTCETFYNETPPIPKSLLEKFSHLFCENTRSNSTNGTTCKHTEPPWALR